MSDPLQPVFANCEQIEGSEMDACQHATSDKNIALFFQPSDTHTKKIVSPGNENFTFLISSL